MTVIAEVDDVAAWVERLSRTAERGEPLDLAEGLAPDSPARNPANADSWGPDRQVPASALRAVLIDPNPAIDPRGLRISGARITGPVDLVDVRFEHALHLTACRVEQHIDLTGSTLKELDLDASHVASLALDAATINGGLLARNGFRADGEVRARGANIAGQLDLTGATLTNPDGVALDLTGATVTGGLLDGDGFTATGTVRALGAAVQKGARHPSRYELGLLFVHGIGGQRQGDTLVQWGDAVTNWMRDWARRCTPQQQPDMGADSKPKPPGIRFYSANLHPADPEPAHGILEIGDDNSTDVRWLVAECWWGGDFGTPSYADLASWSIRALPITVLTQVVGGIKRSLADVKSAEGFGKIYHPAKFVVGAALGIPLAIVLSPLLVGLLLTLLVVGLLPIPALRSGLVATQRVLTGTIGDSLVLLESPVQRAAMTARVTTGIEFLRRHNCPKVIVVAHSQGAAITKRALSESRGGAPIDTLVTVGSGIKKLEALDGAGNNARLPWIASALVVGAAVLTFWIWSDLRSGAIEWWQIGVMPAFIFGGSLILTGFEWLSDSAETVEKAEKKAEYVFIGVWVAWLVISFVATALLGGLNFAASSLLLVALALYAIVHKFITDDEPEVSLDGDRAKRWLDLYSRADPVPNGATKITDTQWHETREVRNLDSPIRDHSYYLKARDDSLARIVACILGHSVGPIQFSDGDVERLNKASDHRQWRLLWLRVTRVVVFVAAVIFLIRQRHDLESSTSSAYRTVTDTLPGLPSWLPGSIDGHAAPVVGIAAVATVGVVLYLAVSVLWHVWDRSATELFFARKDAKDMSPYLYVLVVVLELILLTAAFPGSWSHLGESLSDRFWTLVVIVFGAWGFACFFLWRAGKIRDRRITRKEGHSV